MIKKVFAWFQRLFKKLKRKRRRWHGDAIEFPTFDVDQICDELGIAESAAAVGAHDLPATDAKELDGPQQRIIARLQADIWAIRASANVTYSGLNNRINEIDLRKYRRQKLDQRFEKRLSTLEHEVGVAFRAARERYRGVRKDLDTFKARRRIERQPEDPDSRLWQWSVLVAAFVAEGLMNAIFFERGSERGFVGGATFALALAGVDVLLVFTLGIRAAWLGSRLTWEKAVGGILTLTILAWVVGYNLIVAHVRENLQGGVEINVATEAALDGFRANPLGLAQADSWILFVVGILFSSLAFLSAVKWDDPIRGYGPLHRRLTLLNDDVDFHATQLFHRARDLRDELLDELDTTLRQARSDLMALGHAVETKATMVRNFEGFTRHCNDTLSALLQVYRTENLKHRNTDPPAYFNEPVGLSLVEPLRDSEGNEHEKLAEHTRILRDIETDAERVRDSIDAMFNEFLARARDLTGQAPELRDSGEQSEGGPSAP